MLPRTRQRAFTLVEIALVLLFVLVLFAIAIPNFTEARYRAEVSRARVELNLIAASLETYRQDYPAYPRNKVPRVPDPADMVPLTTPVAYLTRLPRLPKSLQEPRVEIYPEYLNLEQLYPPDKPFQMPPPGGSALYSVSNRGPDGEVDIKAATDPIVYLIYDPTNGTASKGDTVIFGP